MASPLARHRSRLLVYLVLFFAITYLDRVCISVAGPRMQQELNIDPVGWGWVTGMFTLSYCIFEIPTGMLGDRLGPRRVLTRIVLWWSAFTALTGATSSFAWLLLVRFCFGAGEAGAFPNSSVVVSRWFPVSQRATISGVTIMASQIGGGLAPLLVVPIQMRYGWRASFFVFAALGVIWALAWYWWFRDSPAEMPGVAAGDLHDLSPTHATHAVAFPWRAALTNSSLLALVITGGCYAYVYNFFQTWLHTFLAKGRGFSESTQMLSALPYLVAAVTSLTGGMASDALVRRLGVARGRRALGAASLTVAGCFTVAAMLARDPLVTTLCLAMVYGSITFQQAGVFGAILDIGREHAGAVMGIGNTVAQAGGLLGSVAYGYIVRGTGSYDTPFIPMAAALFLGALLWSRIDATRSL